METLTLCSLKVISSRGGREGSSLGRRQLLCSNESLKPGNILVSQSPALNISRYSPGILLPCSLGTDGRQFKLGHCGPDHNHGKE